MSTPGVSIVVPLHDGAGTVIETLAAVRAQTFAAWELIVVDDASTDDGPDLVRAWAEDVPQSVRILASVASSAAGPSATRNRGLQEAGGPVVAFLDADDLWDPVFLARRLEVLAADPSIALVWGPARYWYPDDPALDFDQPTGLDDRRRTFPLAGPLPAWLIDLRHTPCPSAAVFGRDALHAVGGFPEGLRRGEDIAACLLVAADHTTFLDPEVLIRYRRHGSSSTTQSRAQGQRTEDLAFGHWLVDWIDTRADLAELRPLALRCFHGLVHRAVDGLPWLRSRRELSRAFRSQPSTRGRWWAVALDWVLPLAWSRRVAGRLEGSVGHDRH